MLLKKRLILVTKSDNKNKYYALIVGSKLIYSLTSIFSKLASRESFLSQKYCIYYLAIILILGVYAILWQQVLKHVDLSIAMLFKPIALVLCIVWACLIFNEEISLRAFLGFAFVLLGVLIAGRNNE